MWVGGHRDRRTLRCGVLPPVGDAGSGGGRDSLHEACGTKCLRQAQNP